MEYKRFGETKYLVYPDGRIRHMKKETFLNPAKIQGYKAIKIVVKKRTYKHFYVHRLVAELFIPNPDNKREVNHKDFNRLNNHVDNLEWVTPKENTDHAKEANKYAFGEDIKQSTLKNTQVLEIRKGLKEGIRVCELARMYNVLPSTISSIKMNRTYTKVV